MVRLDILDDSLVVLTYCSNEEMDPQEDERAYLAALEEIGTLSGPFALIAILGGERPLSPSYACAQFFWFKRVKDRLSQACRAMALVRPTAAPEMERNFNALFPFSVRVMHDLKSAERFCRQALTVSDRKTA